MKGPWQVVAFRLQKPTAFLPLNTPLLTPCATTEDIMEAWAMAMVALAMDMAVAVAMAVAMVAMVMAAAAHSAIEDTGPVASTKKIQQLLTPTSFSSDDPKYLHKFQP